MSSVAVVFVLRNVNAQMRRTCFHNYHKLYTQEYPHRKNSAKNKYRNRFYVNINNITHRFDRCDIFHYQSLENRNLFIARISYLEKSNIITIDLTFDIKWNINRTE